MTSSVSRTSSQVSEKVPRSNVDDTKARKERLN